MMEDHEFCDSCDGCRPAMLDMKTNKVVPRSDPKMVVIDQIWDNATTYAQRRAYIEVTLKNSREPHNLKLFQEVGIMLQAGLEAMKDE